MHFPFLRHGVPFTCCNHGVRTGRPVRGCFLAACRFSRQERGPAHLAASAVTANFPHVDAVVLRLQSVFPFTPPRFQDAATPGLLLPSKRRPLRQRSPHPNRIVGTISPEAYLFDLPTVGRGRASPVMAHDPFLQAATCITLSGSPAVAVFLPRKKSSDSTPSASRRGGVWHTTKAEMPSPGVFLPGSFVAAPSPDLPAGRL
jgi:hypothetical protein